MLAPWPSLGAPLSLPSSSSSSRVLLRLPGVKQLFLLSLPSPLLLVEATAVCAARAAPTYSLASTMVIGPHHAAVTHVGDSSSEVGQREHMVRLGIHRKCWSEFLCLGDYLARPAAPSQVAGCAPRGALGRHPSADPRRWRRPAGGPVAGAQLGTKPFDATGFGTTQVTGYLFLRPLASTGR
jgi:hypothetical protein